MLNKEFRLRSHERSNLRMTVATLRRIRCAGIKPNKKTGEYANDQEVICDASVLGENTVAYLMDRLQGLTGDKNGWFETTRDFAYKYSDYSPYTYKKIQAAVITRSIETLVGSLSRGFTRNLDDMLRHSKLHFLVDDNLLNSSVGLFAPLTTDYLKFLLFIGYFKGEGKPTFDLQPVALEPHKVTTFLPLRSDGLRCFEDKVIVTGVVDANSSGDTRGQLMAAIKRDYPDKAIIDR